MQQCCHVLYSEIIDQNGPVCWSIVVKEKPTVGSLFFREFPSDRIPKATTDVNVYFFVQSGISLNYTSNLL